MCVHNLHAQIKYIGHGFHYRLYPAGHTCTYVCIHVHVRSYIPQVVEREELQHLKELKGLRTLSLAHNPVDVRTQVHVKQASSGVCTYMYMDFDYCTCPSYRV